MNNFIYSKPAEKPSVPTTEQALCSDLDEGCFTQEWTQAHYKHCASYDRECGFCPFEK